MKIGLNARLAGYAIVAAGVLIGLAGCESTPQVASLDTAQAGANIALAKGTSGTGPGVAPVQLYAIGADSTCASLKVAADMRPLSGKEKAVRVAAGTPLYIYASSGYLSTGSVTPNGTGVTIGINTDNCAEGVSFVPEAGHAYLVQQKTHFGVRGCTVHVTDRTSGADIQPDVQPALSACALARGKKGLEFH